MKIFADTLYPEDLACAACGRELREPSEFSLCPDCRKTLEFNKRFCVKCGAHIKRGSVEPADSGNPATGNAADEAEPAENAAEKCKHCAEEEHAFTMSRAACVYGGSARDMVVALKNGNAWVAKRLALIMAARYPYKDIHIDACMAVPIDKRRLAQRGFNQSALIAKELCKELSKMSLRAEARAEASQSQPIKNSPPGNGAVEDGGIVKETPTELFNFQLSTFNFVDGLAKIKHTEKQALLSGAERAANVKGAYALSPSCPDISGKTILLIDDVFTTGATVSECATAILSGGATAVYVYAFATGR